MAVSLDLISPDLTVDIYDGNLEVHEDWVPETADGFESVTERIPLLAVGTDANVKADVKSINEILRRAVQFVTDETKSEPALLKMETDTGVAQESLIYGGKLVKGWLPGTTFAKVGNVQPYTLVVERHPLWEDATAAGSINQSDIDSYGGTLTLSSITGDEVARFSQFSVSPNSGATADPSNLWVGLHPMPVGEEGNEGDFSPYVYIDTDASRVDTTDCSDFTDVTRHAANYMICTFGTETSLTIRTVNNLDFQVARYNVFLGNYLMLIATKLSAAGTCGIQARVGFASSPYADYVEYPEIEVTNTTWKIHPLGYIRIPPFFPAREDEQVFPSTNMQIAIYAEQISGSPAMYWDTMVLMPTEHAAFVSGATEGGGINIASREDDRHWQYGGVWHAPTIPAALSLKNFGVPPRNSILVVASDEDGVNDAPNTVDTIDIGSGTQYRYRWRNYAQ
jgi:hypothetical protein